MEILDNVRIGGAERSGSPELSVSQFRDLVDGHPEMSAVQTLLDNDLQERARRLKGVLEIGLAEQSGTPEALTSPDVAMELLGQADNQVPGVVDSMFAYPPLGNWLAATITKSRGPRGNIPLWVHTGQLN